MPWIDRASAAVLGFAARRLSQIPVGLLAASRPGEDSLLNQAGSMPLSPSRTARPARLALSGLPLLRDQTGYARRGGRP
jgi:hypothetical protein